MKEFLRQINTERAKHGAAPISASTGVKFLMARKFEIKRAIELFINYGITRYKEGILTIVPVEEPVSSELRSGKFTILPKRDTNGAAIALFRATLHNPSFTTHQAVLKSIIFQLDRALESIDTQRNGIIFIYDMTNSAYHNFDYELCVKMLNLLKGGYPARLKRVLIVSSPLWFRAPFAVLRLFVREKLRDRVIPVKMQDLSRYVPLSSLPARLGGSLTVRHEDWLHWCLYESGYATQSKRDVKNSMSEVVQSCTEQQMRDAGNAFGVLSDEENEIPIRVNGVPLRETADVTANLSASNHAATSGARMPNPGSDSREANHNGATAAASKAAGNAIESGDGGPKTPSVFPDDLHEPYLCEPPPVPCRKSASPPPTLPRKESTAGEAGVPVQTPETPDQTNGHPEYYHSPAGRPSQDTGEILRQMAIMSMGSIHGPAPTPGQMAPDELVTYIRNVGRRKIALQYEQIRREPIDGTFLASRSLYNQPKNRYTDVPCFDHTRVKLKAEPDDPPETDYVNASYMDGYCHPNAFIATQGPLPRTIPDFWRMTWEQKVLIIVMTTRVIEKGRTKCAQYWPTEPGQTATFGNFQVANIHVEWSHDFRLTTLELSNLETKESREIAHYQFTSWPDFGVPRTASAMLNFLAQVRQHQTLAMQALGTHTWTGNCHGPPIIVHCSAGIGRTGTFCTLDICIKRLESVGTVDICETVRNIRTQRALSIQTPDQYFFCHMALVEYCRSKSLMKELKAAERLLDGVPDSDSDSDF